MNSQELKNKDIPAQPGVYFFLGAPTDGTSEKEILYIGKATSLRDRVKSYFASDLIATRGPLIVDMVFKSGDIEWQETDSVLEALILEATLIKKHQPRYNTKEKDDKSWNYIVITDEEWPRVLVVRGRDLEKRKAGIYSTILTDSKVDTVFGPYTNGMALRDALKIVRRIFPFIDRSSFQKDKYEFYRQLRLTPDTARSEAQTEYKETIRHIKQFFSGKKKTIIRELKKKMNDHAKRLEFEEADKVKKTIFSLEHINDVSLIKRDIEEPTTKGYRIEAYDIAHISGTSMVGVMTVVEDSRADISLYRKFVIRSQKGAHDTGALKEVLERRFNHGEWKTPDLIVMDGGVAQQNVAIEVLATRGLSIPVVSVVKDDRHKAREILGAKSAILGRENSILLANSEAHRFAIKFHREKRSKKMMGKK